MSTDRATCVKHIPASFKSSPTFTGRATCVAHDKNLSTYSLNVLETDKTPTLSRICKFAYSSLTNSTLSQRERVKCPAFTLAETLITLGIIGVVAAVTLPSLIQNYKEKETVVRLKKVSSVLSNAYTLMLSEEGIPEDWGMDTDNFGDILTEKFAKYIKNVKICNPANKEKCFEQTPRKDLLNNEVNDMSGDSSLIMSDGMVIGFSYQTSLQLSDCSLNGGCFMINVDINGDKGPNQWGVDTFTFHALRTGILARGDRSASTRYCSPDTNTTAAGWWNGSGCTAWVLQMQNLDYLKCVKGNQKYCATQYSFNQ